MGTSKVCSHKSQTVRPHSAICTKVATERDSEGIVQTLSRRNVLEPNVFGPKEGGQDQAHHRSVGPKQMPGGTHISDGNFGQDCGAHSGGNVGSFPGYRGRIFARTYSPGFSQVLRVYPRNQGIRFSSTTIRPVLCPMGLFQGHETHQEVTENARSHHLLVPRRLPRPGNIKGTYHPPHVLDPRAHAKAGTQDKLGKIVSRAFSKAGVSRSSPGSQEPDLIPPCGKGQQDRGYWKFGERLGSHFQKRFGEDGRIHQLRGSVSSPRSAFPTSLGVLDECSHPSSFEGSPGPSRWSTSDNSSSLVGQETPYCPGSDEHRGSGYLHHDRRISDRVVRHFSGPDDLRRLESSRSGAFHELDGAVCYSQDSAILSSPIGWSLCPSLLRQYNGSGLHSEARITGFTCVVTPGVPTSFSLSVSQDYTGSITPEGGAECFGRPRLKKGDHFHGMVFGSRVLLVGLQESWHSTGGPVCHSGQYSTAWLCVSVSRFCSPGDGCILVGLESVEIHLPLPSTESGTSGVQEACPVQRYGVSDCLPMEGAIMDGSPQGQVQDCIPSEEGLLFVPVVQQHSSVPADSCNMGPSRLDTLRTCLLAKGYDKDTVDIMLKQHRDSSIRQYQSVWGKFLEFLLSKGISHSEVRICHVFSFLTVQVTQFKRQYRTIAVYRCALKAPLLFRFGLDLDSKESESYMRGLFNFRPPRRRADMPAWSLSDLLGYLSTSKFEPLEGLPLRNLTKKTLALIMLSTGRRV